MFASNTWSDFCEICQKLTKIELRQDYNYQAIWNYGRVGPMSLVTGKTRQILLHKSDSLTQNVQDIGYPRILDIPGYSCKFGDENLHT